VYAISFSPKNRSRKTRKAPRGPISQRGNLFVLNCRVTGKKTHPEPAKTSSAGRRHQPVCAEMKAARLTTSVPAAQRYTLWANGCATDSVVFRQRLAWALNCKQDIAVHHRYNPIRSASLAGLALLISWSAWSAPLQAPSLSDIIERVSQNVKEFEESLPDFVCSEKITSMRMESGTVTSQKIVESIFTSLQAGQRGLAFTESRDVVAIDGKPVRPGTAMPRLPFGMGGGFGSLLTMTFSPENIKVHDYEMPDTDKQQDNDKIFVRFKTKPGQRQLGEILNGHAFYSNDIGKALIDVRTMQVLRLERQSLDNPPPFASTSTVVAYGPVTIGEREFWMPQTVRSEVIERNSRKTALYTAEYTDCRKFTATVAIKPAR
jgi:hypothetical protein